MKANCWTCKYCIEASPYDAHRKCVHPATLSEVARLAMAVGVLKSPRQLDIRGNEHGIKSGWFMWPLNFDPVWLENCNGYEGKEVSDETKENAGDRATCSKPSNQPRSQSYNSPSDERNERDALTNANSNVEDASSLKVPTNATKAAGQTDGSQSSNQSSSQSSCKESAPPAA